MKLRFSLPVYLLCAVLALGLIFFYAKKRLGDSGVDDYEHEPEDYAAPMEAEEVSKWFDEWEKK